MNVNELFGKFVADSRRRLSLSQEALASKVNINRATLAKIETGESAPSLDLAIKILNTFELGLKDFEKVITEFSIENKIFQEIKNSDDREKILKHLNSL